MDVLLIFFLLVISTISTIISIISNFIGSIQLFNHTKIFCAPRRFDIKTVRNNDKTSSEIFQFIFLSVSFLSFIVTGTLLCSQILYLWYPILQSKELFFSFSFRRYYVVAPLHVSYDLRRQSPSNPGFYMESQFKNFVSNSQAISTYYLYTLFTFKSNIFNQL